MKVLVLAAGYGTRLARDLEQSDQYQHLRGVPKPLLPIGGLPLISHWMLLLEKCPSISSAEVYVVVNDNNYQLFKDWSSNYPNVKIVSDGTKSNDDRLGAVACIDLAVRHFGIKDHLIVIGGDTLFYDDFNLVSMVERFERAPIQEGGALVTCCRCKDHETTKFGILEINNVGKVTSFLEKPSPEETTSRFSCPCFYMFSAPVLQLLHQFINDYKDAPLSQRDAPGHFIKYLFSRAPTYTYEVSGRYDVGNLQAYIECDQQFLLKNSYNN